MSSQAARSPSRPYAGVSAEDRVAGRRDRFLAAGLELFGTRGFKATGVKDLCSEAGLTDRYFYESFKDSQELFLSVFDGVTGELFESVARAVIEAGADPEAQLRAAISTFVELLAKDPRKARIVFSEPAAAGLEAQEHMRAALARFGELVAATARPHVEGWADEDAVRILALAMVGTMERIVVEWHRGELDLPLERLVDLVSGLFLRLLPRGQ
jgi:AcrR family transcriptional regulator